MDLFDSENIEGLKKEKLESIEKQCFTDTLNSRNPFEFLRQQTGNQTNKPEVMQFKVSQRLHNSQPPTSSQKIGNNDKQLVQPQMPTGADTANDMFDFDILKGARHVHKPKPAPSKSPRSKSTSSLPQTNGTSSKPSSKQANGQTSNKPVTAKKPAPVSFEEMMKLASKNLDAKSQIPPPSKSLQPSSKPKPPQPLSRSKPSSSLSSYQSNDGLSKPRQSNGHASHKPMIDKKSAPVSFEERVKLASKNLGAKSQITPPPKPLQSLSKSKLPQALPRSKPLPYVPKPKSTSSLNQSNTFSPKPSSKQANGQTANKTMTAKNAPPLRFEEMMKLASKNLDAKPQLPPPSKSLQSKPLQPLSRSKSSSSSYQSNAGLSKPRQSNGQASNKQIKKPLPPVEFNEKRKYPLKTSFKDDRASSRPPKRLRYDEEFDDENDSMDDFIVDEEEEDVRKELQSVLRNFYRSDETVWQKREKEIDLSRMNARYQEIDAEEKRSYRIARMEDMIEEKRGSKALK